MKRFLILACVICSFALINSCREPVLEYPITYVVKKTMGDSTEGINIEYYVRGEYLRDTLRDTNRWSADWNALSGEFISLEVESFDATAHIEIEVLNDGGSFLNEVNNSGEYQKNMKIPHTLD